MSGNKNKLIAINYFGGKFTVSDHESLSEHLHLIKGKAMVSGYDGPTMKRLYGDWKMIKFPVKFNNLRSTQVEECVWMNY